MHPTYTIRTSDHVVEAWSTVRLSFEPKGPLRKFRDELRVALRSLITGPGATLHATYGAAENGQFVDTENVLLYNVGTAAFRHLTEQGIAFERAFAYPPPPGGSGMPQDGLHYVRYDVEPATDLRHWRSVDKIAWFEGIDVLSLVKPAPLWAAIRAQAAPPPLRAESPTRFLVSLTVRDRQPTRGTNLAGLVKPALDGVISAFHSHVGGSESVARRLAEAAVGEYDDLRRMLTDTGWGALGPRVLVRPFGARGVQWNPADDYCVAATVVVESAPGAGPRWQLAGELLRAAPR